MNAQDVASNATDDYPVSWRQFLERFDTEQACLAYLYRLRWPQGFACPNCQVCASAYPCSRNRLVCRSCGFQTTVTAGTLFDKTRTPLRVWLAGAWYLANQKHGTSALGLQRALGLGSYQTAWTMLHRLRKAMQPMQAAPLQGVVEIGNTSLAAHAIAIAVEVSRPKGFGQARLQRLAGEHDRDAFMLRSIAKDSIVRSIAAADRETLARLGYEHQHAALQGMPRVAALLKRWAAHMPQGTVQPALLDAQLQEFTVRFNLRSASSAGLLFHQLLLQAVRTQPSTYQGIVQSRSDRFE